MTGSRALRREPWWKRRVVRDVLAAALLLVFAGGVAIGLRSDPDPTAPDDTQAAGPGASTPTQVTSTAPTDAGSASTSPSSAGSPTAGSPDVPRAPRVRHVVVVSMDGFGSQLFESLDPSLIPTLELLRQEGASTLDARTEVERTVTLPNHSGMITGRPVDPAVGGHGVTVNADDGRVTVQALAGGPVTSVFDAVHDSGGSTALFATEDKFAIFERSWPDAIDDFATYQDQDRVTMSRGIDELVEDGSTLTFVHLGLVDQVGHRSGWLSAAQEDAAQVVDGLLGDLVDVVRADRKLQRRTVLVVTADHGGVGKNHQGAGDPRNFRVPFIVWGAGVDEGVDLYALNPQLEDPGDRQPSYSAPKGPVRSGFVANVVTQVLGLPLVEGSVFDTAPLTLCATCAGR